MPEAITCLESLSESSSRGGPVVALIGRQVHKAPEDAIGWAKSVTEPDLNK
jgi:hypothetical protein